jgi:hypothetical protein
MKNAALSVVVFLSASALCAQGLGDAAKKEQQRRKKNAESGVKTGVIGDAELLSAVEGRGTLSVVGSAAAGPGLPEEATPVLSPSPADDGKGASSADVRVPAAEPTDMDRLQDKIEYWRARFRPAKERADALEREVADLEKKARGPGGEVTMAGRPTMYDSMGRAILYGPDVTLPTEAEVAKRLLPERRRELARAKTELSSIEDGARLAGVGSAQLY